MELNFGRSNILCLETALREVRTAEQTQEIKLPDDMPDVRRIVGAWGQGILRGKEWRGDSIVCSAGMMVWVLYAPEDGSAPRCLEGWIPFQMKWELPDGTQEGTIRIRCLPRFVDARPVSARKIMVRAGLSALAEAVAPVSRWVYAPQKEMPGVELLRSVYPLRLQKEAGERSFLQDEELPVAEDGQIPEKILSCRVEPVISDRKVLAEKLVFRGVNRLHALCQDQDGKIYPMDVEIPFSQYAQLSGSYSGDAQGDILLSPTSLELEIGEDGCLRFKCGITAQYMISDKEPVTLIEDAYSPGAELTVNREVLELPAILETRKDTVTGEQTLQREAARIVDTQFLPDFPRQERGEQGVELTFPGNVQILYRDPEQMLQSALVRWEGRHSLPAGEASRVQAMLLPGEARAQAGADGISVAMELPVNLTTTTRQTLSMVTGLTLGEKTEPDPGRPSLILRRPGEQRLWDLAKACGSTVEAIRQANGLTEEPAPDRMLLIPVP